MSGAARKKSFTDRRSCTRVRCNSRQKVRVRRQSVFIISSSASSTRTYICHSVDERDEGRVGFSAPGRAFKPLDRLRVVLLHAPPIVVAHCDLVHGTGIGMIRGLTPPIERLFDRSNPLKPTTELDQRTGRARQRRDSRLLRVPEHPAHRGEANAVSRVGDAGQDLASEVLGDVVEGHGQICAAAGGGGGGAGK